MRHARQGVLLRSLRYNLPHLEEDHVLSHPLPVQHAVPYSEDFLARPNHWRSVRAFLAQG